MTSVVVPDRVSATTWSYRRECGNSDAGKASVSPRPAFSRSTAHDCAMYSDVPHPTIATRASGGGRAFATSGVCASFAARSQLSGCDSISAATNDMRWSPSDAASGYLMEPAVRPPTTFPSIKANRMITGMVAITEPANKWPQSTEYWPT